MIWVKTEAGRVEMQARALVKERARRNLLLVIDGARDDAVLLQSLNGIGPEDFAALEALGLIAPLPAGSRGAGGSRSAASAPAPAAPSIDTEAEPPDELDYATFTARLTQLIAKELGLRGFRLTLAVEKAATIEALRDVAERTLAQIEERRGAATADAARRSLFGE